VRGGSGGTRVSSIYFYWMSPLSVATCMKLKHSKVPDLTPDVLLSVGASASASFLACCLCPVQGTHSDRGLHGFETELARAEGAGSAD